MSISCDCSYIADETLDLYRESYHKARREYVCCECGEKILPGQKYHSATGKADGIFQTSPIEFIYEARKGWPVAIRRALKAEKENIILRSVVEMLMDRDKDWEKSCNIARKVLAGETGWV